jgi:hypothetical protein
MIITAKPDAMMLPRIYLGTPKWWRDRHPEAMVILDHGGTVMRTPCNEFMNVHKRPYASLASPLWRRDMAHQIPFIKAGAPFDSGLLSDLGKINCDQYKLVVFLNTWHIGAADRSRIKRKLATSGRVLVWCYAPGYFQGNTASPAFMEQLTGLPIVPAEDRRCVEPRQALTDAGRAWLHRHQETAPTEPFGMSGERVELFSVAGATEPLACLAGTQVPTMVRKPLENWTSVYSLTAVVTPEIVRAWAREAGVHIFSTSNDTLYANTSYVCINAATAGLKTIVLPHEADVVNALTGHCYGRGVRKVDLSLMPGETKILRYR